MIARLFEDQRFIVLNKPAGLPVHAGPRGGPSIEDVFPTLSRRADGPWLAHRLDADTAGCLVVALRRAALHAAQTEFAAGRAEKVYWAVVSGVPDARAGTVDTTLTKRTRLDGWRMVVGDPAGQRAVTVWVCLGHTREQAWLELRPQTGRTHQLRAHLAHIGHPIVGDPVYGQAEPGGLHLLARAITLRLDPPVHATAPPPTHMRTALVRCGWAD